MKIFTLSLAATGCMLLASTARADQCAWNEPAHATKAEAILAKHPKVIQYCEPCGDKAPGEPFEAREVSVATPQGDYREVSINGQPVDLAYTFVQVSATQYKNLAKMVGCPATDVSATLKVADETPNGVLISQDNPPPPEQPAPVAVAVPPPPPLPEPPPPPVVNNYYTSNNTTVVRPVPILATVAAGVLGFLGGIGASYVLIKLRRRRAMKPRAADLVS